MHRWSHLVLTLFLVGPTACGSSSGPAGAFPNFGPAVQVNASPGASARTLCCSGERLYMAWHSNRSGEDRVYFNYSTDGGRTWQDNDIRIDTEDGVDSNDVHMCCDGLNVCVGWNDRIPGGTIIFVNSSSDGGETWLTDQVQVSPTPSGAGGDNAAFDVMLCCSGQRVYAAWLDNRNRTAFQEARDVYFDYSDDGGVTWHDRDTRMNTNAINTARPGAHRICCDERFVYVTWLDNRSGNQDLFLNSSSDGGGSFQDLDERLDVGSQPGEYESNNPRMCCDGARCYVVWEEGRDGNVDVLGNRSFDAGETWQSAAIEIEAGDSNASKPKVACCDDDVHVLWQDDRDGGSSIYYNGAALFGESFSAASAQRLNVGAPPGLTLVSDAEICCAGSNVYAAWADARDGEQDIYFNYSKDRGATWAAPDLRVDLGDTPGAFDSDRTKLCCEGDQVYVAWSDQRNGGDAFVNRSTP